MPDIPPPNNRNELRQEKPGPKGYLELTDEQRAKAARCDGHKGGIVDHPCKKPMYVCTKCGNYGCSQETTDICSVQGFKNDQCLHCGSTGTRKPLMQDEVAEVRRKWEKEVPRIRE